MVYHVVKVTSYYKDFLSYYYSLYPQIIQKSYKEQHNHLMQQRFAWSDAYASAFESMGLKATEIVANAKPLQEKWMHEHSLKPADDKGILIKQLKQLTPDIVWFQDSYSFNGDFINFLRQEVQSIKLVIGNCCSPISPKYYNDFKAFDFITVCSPYFKQLLESNGLPECLVVPHAFDGRILKEINAGDEKLHDFLFTGSIILDQNFHKERIAFLETLVHDKIDVNLMVNLNETSSRGLRFRQAAYLLSITFNKLGLNFINHKIKRFNKVSKLEYLPSSSKVSKSLQSKIQQPAFGLQMFEAMTQSKIIFNIHGDIAADFAANMRMYEATGIGSCLLTDWKPDINMYFEDGQEVVTYKSFDEAKEKISYLLNNPLIMNEIALNGQQRTLKDHTFEKKAQLIDEKIKEYLMN